MTGSISLESLSYHTDRYLEKIEISRIIHCQATTLARMILNYSGNFEITYSSLICGDKDSELSTWLRFSYLDTIHFLVTILGDPTKKRFNIVALKNGYDVNNFDIRTDNIDDAFNAIIKCAEGKL